MQTSNSTESQDWDAALEASRLTAELEAACRIEATISEDEAEEVWTIPTCSRGRKVVLSKKNPKLDNYFSCLQD
jgi:hypothetical protein